MRPGIDRSLRSTGWKCALIWALVQAAGCGPSGVVQSRLSAQVGGRDIIAVVDGPAFITNTENNDGARISFGDKKVTVLKDQVQIDGRRRASIDPASKQVEIDVNKGAISLKADGKWIPLGQ